MKSKLIVLWALFALIPVTSAYSFVTITPQESYDIVTTDANAFLLDVRTAAEWKWVGHPGADQRGEGAALEGKVINISLLITKKGLFVVNRGFLRDVDEAFEDNPDVTLITMCRSGARGAAAAQILEDNGYDVMNMGEAFQGSADPGGYRTINGWTNSGLPYNFSWGGAYKD